MNLTQIAERYLTFLGQQVEYDASVMSRTWVIVTIVPLVWYFFAALLKWYILLAPITVPLTFWPTVKKITSIGDSWLKEKAKKN